MKFIVALASIGALCLSAVEALSSNHNSEWQSPCEEGDTECWQNLGSDCD
jgi:hypothetical protein